jgi:hypothetical protein
MILIKIIWFIPNLYELKQICFEFIWKYAHCRTLRVLPHRRTLPHTTAHTATLPHSRTLLRTLPHTAAHTVHTARIKVPHTAHRTLHTTLLSHTAMNLN